MIYQFEFEHGKITSCADCPCYDPADGCRLDELDEIEETCYKIPDECPLVAISEMETTSEPCEYCRKPIYLKWSVSFIDGYYKLNDDCNYCPNCGRRLEGTE